MRRLCPFQTGGTAGGRAALEIDSTLAGRAFRQVQTLSGQSDGRGRLWMPLLDGAERLGVLEIGVPDPAELHDPGLRTQCRSISMLLGHLVVLLTQYGDSADLVRLPTPRTVAVAEEMLQSDDWLVLYTDGITEGRDHSGELFGDARMTDFLQREAASGYPPPETARRLVHAVLTHQNGVLQDDATVLLALDQRELWHCITHRRAKSPLTGPYMACAERG
jgi:hypothetical protein